MLHSIPGATDVIRATDDIVDVLAGVRIAGVDVTRAFHPRRFARRRKGLLDGAAHEFGGLPFGLFLLVLSVADACLHHKPLPISRYEPHFIASAA
jgi:hypothetical protein